MKQEDQNKLNEILSKSHLTPIDICVLLRISEQFRYFLDDWYIDGEGFELNRQSALKGENLSNTEIFANQVNQGKIKIPELCY